MIARIKLPPRICCYILRLSGTNDIFCNGRQLPQIKDNESKYIGCGKLVPGK